ncbi:hypothetical protein BVI2075_160115 [Burkholderia vietnamiensis]|nr:hypothetical protein BVI2075_160115 [Burkholderia vietnamiensis]
MLGRDRRGAVPEDRRGRCGRREGRRADPEAPRRGRRSSAARRVPGRRISEGAAVANRLIAPIYPPTRRRPARRAPADARCNPSSGRRAKA